MKKKILVVSFFAAVMLMVSFTAVVGQADVRVLGEEKLKGESLAGAVTGIGICSQFMNSDPAELPEWSIGDFWEYDMSINIAGIVILKATRMDVIVTSDDGDDYTVSLSGYLDKIVLNNFDYSKIIKAVYISGNAIFDKATLAVKEYTVTVTGNMHSPLEIDLSINLKMVFDPALDFLNFPIVIGDQWDIASTVDFTITGYVKRSGEEAFTIDEQSLDNPLNDELSVTTMDTISVIAGDFESYLISGNLGDPSEIWYSPTVGNLVKVDQYIPRLLKIYIKIGFGSTLELLSTNFNYPENNAPDIPEISGPTSGTTGEEYEYTISTTDPNGEQVYYKVDWGDGTCSGWLGPNASGEEVKVKHTWSGKATYKIRVKAKDENGYQSAWSNPFAVTMPVNNQQSSQSQQSTLQQIILRGLPTNR